MQNADWRRFNLVMTSPNSTYKTTKVKFSELKLPTPNLLSKAKPLNVLILKIEGYDVRKRIRVK